MSDRDEIIKRLAVAEHERHEARATVRRLERMAERLREEGATASPGVRSLAEKIATEIERNLRGGL